MNKKEFINAFDFEDKNAVSKVFDKVTVTIKSGRTTNTGEFYPPAFWNKLLEITHLLGVRAASYGVFEEAERRIISFYDEELPEYPVKAIVIENESKFSKLEHKDYLGALMSLGFKREKMGDLIVSEDKCFCAVCEDILPYLIDNLQSVGRAPVSVEELKDLNQIPAPSFETRSVVTTSMRLDCLVSSLTGMSRSRSVDIISGGKVLVNYTECSEKDKMVAPGAIITIRGYGKFKVDDFSGNTGSGRLRLLIKKYI